MLRIYLVLLESDVRQLSFDILRVVQALSGGTWKPGEFDNRPSLEFSSYHPPGVVREAIRQASQSGATVLLMDDGRGFLRELPQFRDDSGGPTSLLGDELAG